MTPGERRLELRAAAVRLRARADHVDYCVRRARTAGDRFSLSAAAFHATALRVRAEGLAGELVPRLREVRAT